MFVCFSCFTFSFKHLSKFPPVFKDIAFWTSSDDDEASTKEFVENDFFDLVRSTAGDLAERIELIDSFMCLCINPYEFQPYKLNM